MQSTSSSSSQYLCAKVEVNTLGKGKQDYQQLLGKQHPGNIMRVCPFHVLRLPQRRTSSPGTSSSSSLSCAVSVSLAPVPEQRRHLVKEHQTMQMLIITMETYQLGGGKHCGQVLCLHCSV